MKRTVPQNGMSLLMPWWQIHVQLRDWNALWNWLNWWNLIWLILNWINFVLWLLKLPYQLNVPSFLSYFKMVKISLILQSKWLSEAISSTSVDSVNSAHSCCEDFLDAAIKLLVNPFVKGTNCNVPETFILDKKRLISLHGKFQDLCIVQCLLLIFKESSKSCDTNMRKCFTANLLKSELLRLLEKPDTQISDISDLMIKSLKDCQIDSIDYNYIPPL